VKSPAKFREGSASEAGFTLAETMIVVTIILIVGGLSIPTLNRVIDNSRLKGAAQTLAATYQNARIRATQDNNSYQVLISPPGITPAQACIDLDGDGVCGAGDPVTPFSPQIAVSNAGVPVPLGPQLNYQVTDIEHSNTYSAQGTVSKGLAWNAVGVPCQRDSATSACLAKGWVQHLQLQRAGGDIIYAAVSVSPTGRIKTWIYISSGNGNGQWL
jgi:Tfp pilus assembly protein FimT